MNSDDKEGDKGSAASSHASSSPEQGTDSKVRRKKSPRSPRLTAHAIPLDFGSFRENQGDSLPPVRTPKARPGDRGAQVTRGIERRSAKTIPREARSTRRSTSEKGELLHSRHRRSTSEQVLRYSHSSAPLVVRNRLPANSEAPVGHVRKRSSDTKPLELSWYKSTDLKKEYPISPLFVVKKAGGILAIAALFIVAYGIMYGAEGFVTSDGPLQETLFLLLRCMTGVALCFALYWEIYRRTLEYRFDGFRMTVGQGVFLRVQGSASLLPVTQVYVHQEPMDVALGLYNVELVTPLTPNQGLTTIPGLSKRSAHKLERKLTDELNRQIFIAPEARELEERARMEANQALA
jgi:membrane protein YdbS with pleckstrin-like domain